MACSYAMNAESFSLHDPKRVGAHAGPTFFLFPGIFQLGFPARWTERAQAPALGMPGSAAARGKERCGAVADSCLMRLVGGGGALIRRSKNRHSGRINDGPA